MGPEADEQVGDDRRHRLHLGERGFEADLEKEKLLPVEEVISAAESAREAAAKLDHQIAIASPEQSTATPPAGSIGQSPLEILNK